MTSTRVRIGAALAAFVAATAVSSCSAPATDQHAGHSSTGTTAQDAQSADHNADDVAFARNMVPHHEQAVEMSQMVPANTTNPDVVALANEITTTQVPEIGAFNAWLMQWGEDSTNSGHSGRGGMGMAGMVDQATMDKLKSLHGPEFDKLWLQSMIGHHQGAITMAQAEIAHGKNPDVIGTANSVVTAQQAEIDHMKLMLGG